MDEIVVPGMVQRPQQTLELRDIALGRRDQVGEGDRVRGVGPLEVEGDGGLESGDGYGEFSGDEEQREGDRSQHEAGDEQLDPHHLNFKNSATAALEREGQGEGLQWGDSAPFRKERERERECE